MHNSKGILDLHLKTPPNSFVHMAARKKRERKEKMLKVATNIFQILSGPSDPYMFWRFWNAAGCSCWEDWKSNDTPRKLQSLIWGNEKLNSMLEFYDRVTL